MGLPPAGLPPAERMQRVLQLAPPVETPGWLQFVRPVHEDATLRLQEETMVVDHGNGVFPEHLLSALDLERLLPTWVFSTSSASLNTST